MLSSCTYGFVQGNITLPAHSMYELVVMITKQDEFAAVADAGNPEDYVNVRIGNSPLNLSLVGRVKNQREPGLAGIRHVVRHRFQGSKFTFRFEWSSSDEQSDKHMVVLRGRYVNSLLLRTTNSND